MFKLDLEKTEEPELNFQYQLDRWKSKFQKNIYFCSMDYAKTFDCVDHALLYHQWNGGEGRCYGTAEASFKFICSCFLCALSPSIKTVGFYRKPWPEFQEWSQLLLPSSLSSLFSPKHQTHPIGITPSCLPFLSPPLSLSPAALLHPNCFDLWNRLELLGSAPTHLSPAPAPNSSPDQPHRLLFPLPVKSCLPLFSPIHPSVTTFLTTNVQLCFYSLKSTVAFMHVQTFLPSLL